MFSGVESSTWYGTRYEGSQDPVIGMNGAAVITGVSAVCLVVTQRGETTHMSTVTARTDDDAGRRDVDCRYGYVPLLLNPAGPARCESRT